MDIPFPADYGGVIDIFFKIKALHQAGVDIILHCFEYGNRKPSTELNKYCTEVYYYPRYTGIRGLHFSLPYIISSRRHPSLLKNLLLVDAPILFEGLHTTFWLNNSSLTDRKKILRAHNIESEYYRQLGSNTTGLLSKIYYFLESNRLRIYEKSLKGLSHILAISEADENYFSKEYSNVPVSYLPAFHANESTVSATGHGSYCLYHGNLSVAENIKSVKFLVEEIFNDLDIPLVIAGKKPSATILSFASKKINIVANPTEIEMQNLIQNAHIHVLPSFQDTGMKLKLMNALFAGRFCILNQANIDDTLMDAVIFADSVPNFKQKILSTMGREFSESDKMDRQKIMHKYLNKTSVHILFDLL